MSVETVLDTNIFIHHLDSSGSAKHATAELLVRDALSEGNACISYQVVQECLNVVLCKAQVALPLDAARSHLDMVLAPLMEVPASTALYHRALVVQTRWRFGFYDSLIVAAALSAGCSTLLSEDLQHAQRIEGLTIVNPFR